MTSKSLLLALLAACCLGVLAWFGLRGAGSGTEQDGLSHAAVEHAGAELGQAELAAVGPTDAPAPAPERSALAATPHGNSAPAAEAAPKSGGVTLAGRVVDERAAPVAGAKVRAGAGWNDWLDLAGEDAADVIKRGETQTDADGRFSIAGLEAGTVAVHVRAAGFAPLDKSEVPLPAEAHHDLGDLQLALGAMLSGRVVDPAGRGVEGARLLPAGDEADGPFAIFASRRAQPLAVSAADGSFRIESLACGPWRILVSSKEHPDRTFSGAAERPGTQQSGLLFELQPGTDIEGLALGVPAAEAAGLKVRALLVEDDRGGLGFGVGGKMREADIRPDGRFTLTGVDKDSTWQLQLRARSKRGSRLTGMFGDQARSGPVRVKSGERDARLTWQNESAIAFRVLDAKSGQPVEKMRVSAGLRWAQPLVGDDGKTKAVFAQGQVRCGELYPSGKDDLATVEIRAAGYQEYRRDDIALLAGADLDLGEIKLEPTPVLVVRVTDAKSGQPLPDARVTLRRPPAAGRAGERSVSFSIGNSDDDATDMPGQGGGSSRARTDQDGVALLTSFPGETCSLRAEAEGHAPVVVTDLKLPEGERVEREVALGTGGSVLVRALDSNGVPLAGARIAHREPSSADQGISYNFGPGGSRDPVTDSKGEARVELLTPGTHAFKLDDGGKGMRGFGRGRMRVVGGAEPDESWSEVEVKDGEQAELVLRGSPHGSLEGRVREAGQALAGANLSIEIDDGGNEELGLGGRMFLTGASSDSSSKTDGEGRYRFDNLKVGKYKLTIEHPSRAMPAHFKVEISEGSNRFDVELQQTVIEGRITDSKGDPLPGIRVRAEQKREDSGGFRSMIVMAMDDGGGEVISVGDPNGTPPGTTDADGHYSLRGVAADVELVVKADSKQHQPKESDPLRLAPGEVKRGVDMVLEVGGEVSVDALQADGKPARFVMVTGRWLGEGQVEPKTAFIGPTGKGKLSGLKPGQWKVEVRKMGPGSGGPNAPAQDKDVEVKPGEKAELSFTLD